MKAVPTMVLCKILPFERTSYNWLVLIRPTYRNKPRSSRGRVAPMLNMATLAKDWRG